MTLILFRIAALVIGYLIGSFQTGFFYGKSKGIDIRDHGSGNSGTTNTLRTLGWKAGAVTFLGDSLKAVLAVFVVWLIFHGNCGEEIKLIELYAGFGAVLGHNFPFYMRFRGGKGIACTAGLILAVSPLAVPACLFIFVLLVAVTRYVSVGSIVMVCVFLIQIVLFNYFGIIGVPADNVLEFDILTACFTAMGIYRHKENIRRLLNGTENKIGKKAK